MHVRYLLYSLRKTYLESTALPQFTACTPRELALNPFCTG